MFPFPICDSATRSHYVPKQVFLVYRMSDCKKTNKQEEKGSSSNSSFTIDASPSIDLRKSVVLCARYTFSIAISDIIVVSPLALLVRSLA